MFKGERYMINKERVVDEFVKLVKINSHTRKEREMADFLLDKLRSMGLDPYEDRAHDKFGGNAGNIIVRLEGRKDAAPLLFCAHMDRVAPGENINPVIKEDKIYSDGTTVLGSDDAAGIVAILEALICIQEKNLEHGDLEFIFTAGEEEGLLGSKNLDFKKLRAFYCYVLDAGGPVGTIVNQAPGQHEILITVRGLAAHAGSDVEKGINAIMVVSDAVNSLRWGRIDKNTTSNLGVIQGGRATNIVCDLVQLKGEVRSLDMNKLDLHSRRIGEHFKSISRKWGAQHDFNRVPLYSPFKLEENAKIIRLVQRAALETGLNPRVKSSGGGSDANIFNARGIPALNLGIGTEKAHTREEFISITDLVYLAELILNIIKVS